MNDKNREYEEILKELERDYLAESDNDGQRQSQKRHSDEHHVPQRTPQPKKSLSQSKYSKANNRECKNPERYMPKKRRSAKKRKQYRWIAILVAAIMVIFLAVLLIVIFCGLGRDVLNGIWNLDDITVYQFDGKGNGSLNLPDNTYPFTYEINDNSLSIDFESKAARDITYTFTVREEKLVLVSIEKGKKITYKLTKQKASKK